MKELLTIQTELVSNKDKRNDFGKFNYRSLEDIMNSVKPLLLKTKCTLTFTDDLVLIGERFYIKSTATLENAEGNKIAATAFAREQEEKKGLDDAQVTGLASSYARKYAACSLLGISDGFDPDALDNREEGEKKATKTATKTKVDKEFNSDLDIALNALKSAKTMDELKSVCTTYKAAYGKNPQFSKLAYEIYKTLANEQPK